MNEKLITKRNIEYNANKIEELEQEFKTRSPAKATYQFINKVDIAMAVQSEHVKNLTKSIESLSEKMDNFIETADKKYADREQFLFWRWVLIVGVILSAVIGIWFK